MSGVTSRHPDYLKYEKQWQLIRDSLEGQAAIKKAGEKYLLVSGGQKVQEAKARAVAASGPWTISKMMARYPELLEPAAMGFTGLATRIPWEVHNLPAAMEYIREDAGCNLGVEGWQSKLIYSGLTMGRSVLFPDAPKQKGKPKIQFYAAEAFTNWQVDEEYGSGKLELGVLQEKRRKEQTDIFAHDQEDIYRVVSIEGGTVKVQIWTSNGGTRPDTAEDPLQVSYTEMPIIVCGTTENTATVQRPPLIGIADCAVSAYQLSALLRWSLRASSDPILFAQGFEENEIKLIGAGSVLEKPGDPSKSALSYITPDSAAWQLIQSEIRDEIEKAKEAGHSLKEKSGVESGTTTRQHTQSKTATLKSIDRCSARAFQDALNMMARMQSLPDNILVQSALSYTDEDVDATVLTAITGAVEKDQLPRETTIEYVKDRGMLENMEVEDVIELLDEQMEDREARAVGFANAMGDNDDEEEEEFDAATA